MSANQLRGLNALVVGGGATGRVIGKHLVNAGANIALLLKPRYAAVADQGFELHKLRTFSKKRQRQRFDDFRILTDPHQLSHNHFDQIYICVNGPDLRNGWLEQAWPHLRHSLWISMQPGVDDYQYLTSIVPERYLVQGTIGFVAYRAPLPSEEINPPGIAYWFPPTQITAFSAQNEDTMASIVNLLAKGGLPTAVVGNFPAHRLFSSAAAIPFAAALEIHDWSLEAMRADAKAIARICVAMAELAHAIEARTGGRSKLLGWLRKPWFWRFMLKHIESFTPMPFSEYMQDHFLHKREQTEQQFSDFITLIKKTGGTPTATNDIAKEWARTRPAVGERQEKVLLAPEGLRASTTERSVFSESGQLGGEARGKAAADERARQLAQRQSGPQNSQPPHPGHQQPPSPASQSGGFQRPGKSSFGPGNAYRQDDTLPPHGLDDD